MRPQSEQLRISKPSRPYSSLKTIRAVLIAKGISVSGASLQTNCALGYVLDDAEVIVLYRSKMGELESGSVCVHTVLHDLSVCGICTFDTNDMKLLWDTPGNGYAYQPSEVSGPGFLDG